MESFVCEGKVEACEVALLEVCNCFNSLIFRALQSFIKEV